MEPITQTNKCANCGADLTQDSGRSFSCGYCGSTYQGYIPHFSNSIHSDDFSVQVTNILITNNDVLSQTTPRPAAKQSIPSLKKETLFIRCIWVYFACWVALYFCRLNMPDGTNNLNLHNSILFSPMGGFYWWLRGIIFLGILPLLTFYVIKKPKSGKFNSIA